jgi:hypothetical protein
MAGAQENVLNGDDRPENARFDGLSLFGGGSGAKGPTSLENVSVFVFVGVAAAWNGVGIR